MTNEQFYNLVLSKARRPNDTALRALVEAEFRQILQSLENSPFHPWFLERTSSGLTASIGAAATPLPTDFLLQVEDTNLYLIDSAGTRSKVIRRYHEDLEELYDTSNVTLPEIYDIFAGLIYFVPIPDQAYVISLKYYQKSTAPAVGSQADVTNLWIINAEEYTVSIVAQRLCSEYTKDMALAESLGKRVGELRSEMYKYNEARKHTNMDYAIER